MKKFIDGLKNRYKERKHNKEQERLQESLSLLTYYVDDISESENFSTGFFWRIENLAIKYPSLIEDTREDISKLNYLISIYNNNRLEQDERHILAIERIKPLIDKIEKIVVRYKEKEDKKQELIDFHKRYNSKKFLEDALKKTEDWV